MNIEIRTDHNISGPQDLIAHYTSLIEGALDRFATHITSVEVHLSDENAKKGGADDIKCMIAARVKGKQTTSVTNHDSSLEAAVNGAIKKLKVILDKEIDKMQVR